MQYHEIDTVPSTGGAITPLTASNALGLAQFMSFDSQGNIWVSDRGLGVVEFHSVTGQVITSFSSFEASEFEGIAVGPSAPGTSVPESSSLLLLGFGLGSMAAWRRRRNA